MIFVCGLKRTLGMCAAPSPGRWGLTIASDDVIVSLGKYVSQLEMNKASIGWDLEQLEAATEGLEERDSDSDDETTDGSYE